MIKRGDKNAQGLSTSAIILIILGVVVLVILIFGFTMGWDKIAPWIKQGTDNTDSIKQSCQLACTTDSISDFCSKEREVEFEDNTKYALYGLVEDGKYTCESLAHESKTLGVDSCNSIDCTVNLAEGADIKQLQEDCINENNKPETQWIEGTIEPKGVYCEIYIKPKTKYYCCEKS